MGKTTIQLPESLHRKLRVKAALEGRSMNAVIREALEHHLDGFQIRSGMLEREEVSRAEAKEV